MGSDLNAHAEYLRRRKMTLFGSQNVKKALVICPAVKVWNLTTNCHLQRILLNVILDWKLQY